MFLVCLGLSLVCALLPTGLARHRRRRCGETVLAPLVWLQSRAEEGRTSRARFLAVTAQRDSAAYLAQALPVLRAENERLRQLLALSQRLIDPLRAGRGAAPVAGHRRPDAAAQRRRA